MRCRVKQKVHSFDLVAANERITACDIAHVPLPNGAVDVGIFCLSLMGTNFADFLREAHRVLKLHGQLLIAEVKSRIPDLDEFVALVEELGFDFVSKVGALVAFSFFLFPFFFFFLFFSFSAYRSAHYCLLHF